MLRAFARIKKIENQVYDGKNIILPDFLKRLPKDKAYDGIRQLFIEHLPNRVLITATEFLNVFPEDFRIEFIQIVRERYNKS